MAHGLADMALRLEVASENRPLHEILVEHAVTGTLSWTASHGVCSSVIVHLTNQAPV